MRSAYKGKVLLLTGPAGSGKTTLATIIAQHPQWRCRSEDDAWIRIKAGHPAGEARTSAEEQIVQEQTLDTIMQDVDAGTNVVLEFILYENPPTPLIAYRERLLQHGADVLVRVLRASEDALWERKVTRGRSNDRDEVHQRQHARQQLACLDATYIDPAWIVDTTHKDAMSVYREHLQMLL